MNTGGNNMHFSPDNNSTRAAVITGISMLLCLLCAGATTAGELERRQAKRLHDRLAGVPPAAAVLDSMEADIVAGNALAAARTAMDNSAFYNVTLKNFASPWSNRGHG